MKDEKLSSVFLFRVSGDMKRKIKKTAKRKKMNVSEFIRWVIQNQLWTYKHNDFRTDDLNNDKIIIHITEKQKEEFNRAANLFNISASEYLRQMLFYAVDGE